MADLIIDDVTFRHFLDKYCTNRKDGTWVD